MARDIYQIGKDAQEFLNKEKARKDYKPDKVSISVGGVEISGYTKAGIPVHTFTAGDSEDEEALAYCRSCGDEINVFDLTDDCDRDYLYCGKDQWCCP